MQHGEFTGSSGARQRYWARSYIGWQRFSAARPNAGHRAVATLQAGGLLGPVVTQNVDGLHQEAGARDVVELHGSLAEVVCLACGERSDRERLQDRMTAANPGFLALATAAAPDGSRVSSQIRPDGDIVLADGAVACSGRPTAWAAARTCSNPTSSSSAARCPGTASPGASSSSRRRPPCSCSGPRSR